jgi:hypothetical protein
MTCPYCGKATGHQAGCPGLPDAGYATWQRLQVSRAASAAWKLLAKKLWKVNLGLLEDLEEARSVARLLKMELDGVEK